MSKKISVNSERMKEGILCFPEGRSRRNTGGVGGEEGGELHEILVHGRGTGSGKERYTQAGELWRHLLLEMSQCRQCVATSVFSSLKPEFGMTLPPSRRDVVAFRHAGAELQKNTCRKKARVHVIAAYVVTAHPRTSY